MNRVQSPKAGASSQLLSGTTMSDGWASAAALPRKTPLLWVPSGKSSGYMANSNQVTRLSNSA